MKKTHLVIAAITVLMLLSVPTISEAKLPCKESVLNDCINRCKDAFGLWNPLFTYCVDGCYIGCYLAGSVE